MKKSQLTHFMKGFFRKLKIQSFHFFNFLVYRVVTGIMILKLNGLIQLAVIEKKLLPFGEIEKSTKQKFVFNYKRDTIYDTTVFNRSDNFTFRQNIDYFTLSYANRSMNLDTIVAPANQLVTGVRFQLRHGHLQLQIRVTEFDFVSGKLLNVDQSAWLSNDNGGQVEIKLDHPNNPCYLANLHSEDDLSFLSEKLMEFHTPDAYVRFQPSDAIADFSRVTVPFIESYPIKPYEEVPLAGVGIYYKGGVGNGGFIAPKLIVYDFASHIH